MLVPVEVIPEGDEEDGILAETGRGFRGGEDGEVNGFRSPAAGVAVHQGEGRNSDFAEEGDCFSAKGPCAEDETAALKGLEEVVEG